MSFTTTPAQLAGQLAELGLQTSRRELVAQDRAAAERMIETYQRLIAPVRQQVQTWEVIAATPAELERLANLSQLQDQIAESLAELQVLIQRESAQLQDSAIDLGTRYARESVGIVAGWNVVDPRAIRETINIVDSQPFQDALNAYPEYHAQQVRDLALAGISNGWNPSKTARVVVNYLDRAGPSLDAERMMRTVQMYAYRRANAHNWQANSQVVRGWYWRADLGNPRTCISCIAMHGQRFPVTQVMNDHHRGRCLPVPIVPGRELPAENAGQQWLEEQDEPTQRRAMGRARWFAWRDGAFQFRDLSTTYQDSIYGEMRTEASLVSLVGEDAAREYKRQAQRNDAV